MNLLIIVNFGTVNKKIVKIIPMSSSISKSARNDLISSFDLFPASVWSEPTNVSVLTHPSTN